MGTRVDNSQTNNHDPAVLTPKPRPISWRQWEAVARACAHVTPLLTQVIQQFWGMPVQVKFFSASTRNHYYWQADDFHVSQLILPGVKVPSLEGETQAMALMRISDTACSSLISQVLGPQPNGHFSFNQLSPLEATILNEFSRDLLSVYMKNLIKKPKPNRKTRMDLVNLMWTLQLEEPEDPLNKGLRFKQPPETGKILLTLPVGALKAEALKIADPAAPEPEPTVMDGFFYHVQSDVSLFVGNTHVALSDLDSLEKGDLVILENSDANQLYLVEPESGIHLPFTPGISHKQRLLVPIEQDLIMMEPPQETMTGARQQLWDNLQIEVDAQFMPIKLPLKQLKQMSEGLIVEMGDLIHNDICLSVEGKPLAYGELVIVGDKFGVRIKQVKGEAEEEAAAEAMNAPGGMMDAMAPEGPGMMQAPPDAEAPAAEGEEAALEQFLNDDFDDTFDDEEDW